MKYIKEYNEYKDRMQDIRDCFQELIDSGASVKITCPAPHTLGFGRFTSLSKAYAVSVSLDGMRMETAESEWGVRYSRPERAEELAMLAAEAAGKCEGYDFVLERAEIGWVNAGEWLFNKKESARLKTERTIANSIGKTATPEEIESMRQDLMLALMGSLGTSGTGPGSLDRIFDKESRYTHADAAKDPAKKIKMNISELEPEIMRAGPRFRQMKLWFIE
jgi:hypothetical protein